ncbi:MAG TPA: hypothetical protein PK306_02855 [Aquabacterium sp.]|jgi:hypothetical protein|uniref:hypothetical protein n=1 Tax=Comamonadaceae TaxID=80864 RepID=UPI001FCC2852|nr:hypothetical protein [Delftia lacustris]BDE73483.1 hypothetical protein HQS1_46070 [Delftia lacustris]HQC94631.1 hypothetical protein [Aquabacterium sp.]
MSDRFEAFTVLRDSRPEPSTSDVHARRSVRRWPGRVRQPPGSPTQELLSFLQEQGYRELRLIGDVLCGLHRYNFTTGLAVGLTFECYERRYCFEHSEDALRALRDWDGQGHPSGPWIKCKGAGVDLLNPALTA